MSNASKTKKTKKLLVIIFLGCGFLACESEPAKFTGAKVEPEVFIEIKNEKKQADAIAYKSSAPIEIPEVANISLTPPPKKKPPKGIEIIDDEMASQKSEEITVTFKVHELEEGEEAKEILLQLQKSNELLALEKSIALGDLDQEDGLYKVSLPEGLDEDKYNLRLTPVGANGAEASSVSTLLYVDKTSPIVNLKMGVSDQVDGCSFKQGREFVSTRVIAFNGCVDDGKVGSGAALFCMFSKKEVENPDFTPPTKNSKCWQSWAGAKLVNLSNENNGVNEFKLYLLDQAGNMGEAEGSIKLAEDNPPRVDILKPTAQKIREKGKWQPNENLRLEYKITDESTNFRNIKIAVSIYNANDYSEAWHVGCNFSNNALSDLCPSVEAQSSSLLKVAQTADQGYVDIKLDPSFWDPEKQYVIVVKAADKASNVAIASTQEINSPWEVLAGRSYSEAGASGQTLLRNIDRVGVAADKNGQVYDTTTGIMVRAFDSVTCRYIRTTQQKASSFDCPKILVTDEPLLTKEAMSQSFWQYDPTRDVFYVASLEKDSLDDSKTVNHKILKVNLNAGTVTTVLGEGTANLSYMALGHDAKDFKLENKAFRLYFDPTSDMLYIAGDSQLVAMDSDQKVYYIAGSSSGTIQGFPEAQVLGSSAVETSRKDVVIPMGAHFATDGDGNFVFVKGPAPGWNNGSGLGLQYALIGAVIARNEADTESKVGYYYLTVGGPTWKAGVTDTGLRHHYLDNIIYNPILKRYYADANYRDVYSLPKFTSKEQIQVESFSWVDEGFYPSHSMSGHITFFPNSTLALANNYKQSIIFQRDVTNKPNYKPKAVLGFQRGSEPNQLGINRYLDNPTDIQVYDNKVYFTDFYNLQLLEVREDNWYVSTLAAGIDSSFGIVEDTIIEFTAGKLNSYNLLGEKINERSFNYAGGYSKAYDNQWGFSYEIDAQGKTRVVHLASKWDGHDISMTSLFNTLVELDDDKKIKPLSPNRMNTNYSLGTKHLGYCGSCPQGALKTSNSGGSYIEPSSYRYPEQMQRYGVRADVALAAVIGNDRIITVSNNDQMQLIDNMDPAQAKFWPFTVSLTGSAEKIKLNRSTTRLKAIKGKVYFTDSNQIYKLADNYLQTVTVSNSSSAEPLLDKKSYPEGVDISSFWIEDDYIYYLDKASDRVFRVKR